MTPGPAARVLVVDDSPYTRQMIRAILKKDPLVGDVEVAGNGKIALEKALRRPPDLVTLDLQMPVMDGFTFLRMFRTRSRAPVLVLSSYAELDNVEKALSLGATGFLSKPDDPYRNFASMAEELTLKLRQHLDETPAPKTPPEPARKTVRPVEPRDFPVVAIGSSSGGPSTLQYLLTGLPRHLNAAVLVAQHMPVGFTETFARRLDSLVPYSVREARDGDPVRVGEVLVAPGGRHLAVTGSGVRAGVVTEEGGKSLYVPSIDRLLDTASTVFGPRLTAVILTGMGRDGSEGVRVVKERGGWVIAESEQTATIFGMPREAAATGCVDEVLPLPEIAVRLIRLFGVHAAGPGPAEDVPSRGVG